MMKLRHGVAALCVAAVVSGCQPALHSELPLGSAAYEAISIAPTDALSLQTYLQPGDQIGVNVFQEQNLSTESAMIDQAGNVSLPLIGEIRAAGLSSAELAREVERAYGQQYLRDPHVNIVLIKGTPRVMAVEGQVDQPGVFEVQPGYTLLTALALAGSPTEEAKLDEVLIFRNKGGERFGGRFDLTDIRAGRAGDPQILPGDVIVVGYSSVRGAYLDFLKTAPIFGAVGSFFTRY